MRIAILTQPLRYNYGGILQNFALQTVLRRMGHKAVTIDPHRYMFPWWQHPLRIARHLAGRYLLGHHNNSILGEWRADNEIRKPGTNTFRFIDKYIKRKEYKNLFKDVCSNDFDAYIVGSDQVWRPEYNANLPNMFLDFTHDWDVRRIAYAASFGVGTWSADASTTDKCLKGLRLFDLVTVREDSGRTLCRSLFGADAQQVLDPTLLLIKEDYIKLVRKKKELNTIAGDLYLYILDETEYTKRLTKELSNILSMDAFSYNTRALDNYAYRLPIEDRIQLPVELWIKGFDQAKIVLTDSFHACIFSIIFRKQFFLIGNKDRGMDRYFSLFNQLGIANRMIHTADDIHSMRDINYDEVYARLEELRNSSMTVLKDALR